MKRHGIRSVRARQILDCRGEPTVEVDVTAEDGSFGRADVPVGRSRASSEAYELRDGGRDYLGRGVLTAVRNVNDVIAPAMMGTQVTDQAGIDNLMIRLDGTSNKSKLGGNAIVGVSIAAAKCAANSVGIPLYRYLGGPGANILPVPFFDMIEGGKLAASDLDAQEHQVVPMGAKTFSDALRIGMEVYWELGRIISKKYGNHSTNLGVEGGYAPQGMKRPQEAFDAELQAIEELGYQKECKLAADFAATHLYDRKTKTYRLAGEKRNTEQMIDFYQDLVESYPIVSIEDPLEENDFEGFSALTRSVDVQIIGDDLFATNPERLRKGIETNAANALLFKVNQIGTLTEALQCAELAFGSSYGVQVSERSGQTEDTWLADLSVGLSSGQIKTGVNRSERTAQYNQLIRIEEELESARYAGPDFRDPPRAS
jgi:enolase